MIKSKAHADARAAIMAHQRELYVAQALHDLHGVGGHQALGVILALVAVRRRRPAIAAQIHRDDGEALGQRGRNLAPRDIGLAKAVQQKHRRPRAMGAGEDLAGVGVDPVRGEAGVEVGGVGHCGTSLGRLN